MVTGIFSKSKFPNEFYPEWYFSRKSKNPKPFFSNSFFLESKFPNELFPEWYFTKKSENPKFFFPKYQL